MDCMNESFESLGMVNMMKTFLEGCPGYPYIESGARSCTKKKVLLTEVVMSLREET
jgi:hypothetical protein